MMHKYYTVVVLVHDGDLLVLGAALTLTLHVVSHELHTLALRPVMQLACTERHVAVHTCAQAPPATPHPPPLP